MSPWAIVSTRVSHGSIYICILCTEDSKNWHVLSTEDSKYLYLLFTKDMKY